MRWFRHFCHDIRTIRTIRVKKLWFDQVDLFIWWQSGFTGKVKFILAALCYGLWRGWPWLLLGLLLLLGLWVLSPAPALPPLP